MVLYHRHPPSCFLVPSSGVVAMAIDGSSPSSSVIRHLSFPSHHFHVHVNNIHPSFPRSSSCSFSRWFHHVYYLPAGMFKWSSSNTSIVCLSLCLIYSSLRLLFLHMYSFLFLFFLVIPHIYLDISFLCHVCISRHHLFTSLLPQLYVCILMNMNDRNDLLAKSLFIY